MLQFAVPVGPKFPNWHHASFDDLRSRFELPLDGIYFDVEHNNFWLPEWGGRPSTPDGRREVVRRAIELAPRLIPIFSHRFLPSAPYADGNPVFSVHQTDIIYYGNDLAGYFHNEFRVPIPEWAAKEARPIHFWDDSLRWR